MCFEQQERDRQRPRLRLDPNTLREKAPEPGLGIVGSARGGTKKSSPVEQDLCAMGKQIDELEAQVDHLTRALEPVRALNFSPATLDAVLKVGDEEEESLCLLQRDIRGLTNRVKHSMMVLECLKQDLRI